MQPKLSSASTGTARREKLWTTELYSYTAGILVQHSFLKQFAKLLPDKLNEHFYGSILSSSRLRSQQSKFAFLSQKKVYWFR